jgi:signal transduction histidine kinase
MLRQETRREYLSEAFHSLGQPLTALQCGLELAIAIPRSQKEYERRVGDALQSTSSLREMVAALRELVEAEDSGEDAVELDLGDLFSSLNDSLHKIATLYESGLDLESPHMIRILASQEKISAVVLFLAEQAVTCRCCLRVKAERVDRNVEIRIETDGKKPAKESEARSWRDRVIEMRISAADNYIATLGGVLRTSTRGYNIELPLVRN